MELQELVNDVAKGLSAFDSKGERCTSRGRTFQPGAGPFGESELVKQIAVYLNTLPKYGGSDKEASRLADSRQVGD
jgi:hypothetical protein